MNEVTDMLQTQLREQIHNLEWCLGCGSLRLGKIEPQFPSNSRKCISCKWIKVFKINDDPVFIPVPTNYKPTNGKKSKLGGVGMGQLCPNCGTELVRNGSCGICPECATSGGCS